MFPSLVNCCTIDWFTEWPGDALEKVATKFLEDMDMDDEVKKVQGVHSKCVDIFIEHVYKKWTLYLLDRHRKEAFFNLCNVFVGP